MSVRVRVECRAPLRKRIEEAAHVSNIWLLAAPYGILAIGAAAIKLCLIFGL